MDPLLLRPSGSKDATTNISRVFDIDTVVKIEDTILDQEFQEKGATVELPVEVEGLFGPVSSMKLPPCPTYQDEGMVVLDEIAVRVNNLLRVIRLVEIEEKQPVTLKKSVRNLQLSIVSRLVGKNGTVCRDVLGRRVSNTCRAVLLPSYSHDPSIAYMPVTLMRKMGVQDGRVVIVGRDPTIWHGSVEVLIAKPVDGTSIRLHPFVFKQFGADCDGDCVWAMAIPDELQSEMQKEVLSFTKKHAQDASMVGSGSAPEPIDWDNPEEASQSLWMSSGFSVSPEDLLNDTDDLARFRASSGKNIGEEARKIAAGGDNQLVLDYLTVVNNTMLIQKVWLGPVGAAAQKMKLISSRDARLRESANYMSEKLQQGLFDVKGSVTGDDSDLSGFFELLHIVNMTNEYSSNTNLVQHEDVIDRLVELGLDREMVSPIITFIYSVYPLMIAIRTVATKIDTEHMDTVFIDVPSLLLDGVDKETVMAQLSELTSVPVNVIASKCRQIKAFTTLGRVLSDPLYDLINPFSDKRTSEAIMSLSARLAAPSKVITFTRLTDTILDISLESALVATNHPDVKTSPAGLPVSRDGGGGGGRVPDLQDRHDGHNDEEGAVESQLPSRSTESG